MNVLLISSKPSNRGGIAIWVGQVLDYFRKHSELNVNIQNISYRQYKKNGKHSITERIIVNGCDIFRILREVASEILHKSINVIHITGTGDWSLFRDIALMKFIRWKKIPIIYHLHFGRLAEYKNENGRNWKLLKLSIELADEIWVLDRKTQEAISESFPDKKVVIMPNPIDETTIDISACENDNSIMYLGWVIKEKGIEELLQVWRRVEELYPVYTLKIIGSYDESYLHYLQSTYETNRVHFLGLVSHEKAMLELKKTNLFVLPSYSEGFPYVILEAMMCKKPIVATNVGAIADMLSENCGCVIAPHNEEELYDAIVKILRNQEYSNNIAQNAFEKATAMYTISNVCAEYVKRWTKVKKRQLNQVML